MFHGTSILSVQLPESRQHLLGRLVAVTGLGRHGLLQDGGHRGAAYFLPQRLHLTGILGGFLSGNQMVQGGSQAVDIRSHIQQNAPAAGGFV